MDVEENVKLDMERNVEEALLKLIPVKTREIFGAIQIVWKLEKYTFKYKKII